ncbi:MAG: RidA family protein [Chloroflexi bacterium]|nr:RidA family protein [Chloroflexota bacterium]MBI3177830.1 RidA family protein [Chloroflexota bacterium]
MPLNRTVIHSDSAPKAIGPYSQAIRVGDLVFAAGQTPIDPATGNLVEGDIETQTRRVLLNIKVVLEAAGSGLDKVVKTTVFMTNLGDFARMNAVYGEYFPANPPARSTVQVAALPKAAQVEIECVAVAQ